MEETKRVFVSLLVPDEIKQKISNFIQTFDGLYPHPAENLHITVKFMGNINEEQVAMLENLLEFTAQQFAPVPIHFYNVRSIESRLRLVAKKMPEIQNLFDTVVLNWQNISPLEEDKIPFEPHVTLGRYPKTNQEPIVFYNFANFDFTADTLVLYETRQGEKAAQYVPLKKVKLSA